MSWLSCVLSAIGRVSGLPVQCTLCRRSHNPIDYSCFLLRRTVVIKLHQALSECLVGAEADLDVQEGEYSAYGLGEMTD